MNAKILEEQKKWTHTKCQAFSGNSNIQAGLELITAVQEAALTLDRKVGV